MDLAILNSSIFQELKKQKIENGKLKTVSKSLIEKQIFNKHRH